MLLVYRYVLDANTVLSISERGSKDDKMMMKHHLLHNNDRRQPYRYNRTAPVPAGLLTDDTHEEDLESKLPVLYR